MQNLKLLAFLICLSIGVSAARALVSFIYTCELTLPRNKGKIIVFCFFLIGIKLIGFALHKQFMDGSVMIIIWFNIFVNLITLPLQAFYLPETPHYLYSRGRMQDFYDSLI